MPLAKKDLADIYDYHAKYTGPGAEKILFKIGKVARLLAWQPGMGKILQGSAVRQMVVVKTDYNIAYHIKNGRIEILRILHSNYSPEQFIEIKKRLQEIADM